MHIRPQLSSIRSRFGYPYHPWWNQEFDERGFKLVQRTVEQNRYHDVTMLIEGVDGRFALMSKHSYPPGIFRSPSGGVNVGEDIAAGALREAHEETGLAIDLKQFLAHITLDITFEKDVITWDSYIFYATTRNLHLKPIDLKEVKDALWATPMQMREMIEKLKATEVGGLVYRGNLTELSLWALKNKLVMRAATPLDNPFIVESLVEHKQDMSDMDQTHWWIAEVNELPVATLGLVARGDCVEMTGLTVDLAYQGRGIGQALAEYVCDQWRNPVEHQKMGSLNHISAQEPLWLITSNPAYYLNIDFEMLDHDQAPKSLRGKLRGAHSHDSSMRFKLYKSKSLTF